MYGALRWLNKQVLKKFSVLSATIDRGEKNCNGTFEILETATNLGLSS